MDDFFGSCSFEDQLSHSSLVTSFEWMCGAGKQDYIEHHECLTSEVVHMEAVSCVDVFATHSQEATSSNEFCR